MICSAAVWMCRIWDGSTPMRRMLWRTGWGFCLLLSPTFWRSEPCGRTTWAWWGSRSLRLPQAGWAPGSGSVQSSALSELGV